MFYTSNIKKLTYLFMTNSFNKLNNGTEYRTTETGYVLKKGKREIYVNAKSVIAGNKAKEIIANNSFNQIFSMGKKINLFGSNASHLYL